MTTPLPEATRPAWVDIWIGLARQLSERSTCTRTRVGCVIVSADNQRVLAVGYNGGPRGIYNECLSSEPGKCGHLHAEINALIKCNTGDPAKKIMYTTLSPCYDCAIAIVNSGIYGVVYETQYRKTEGLDLLRKAGIFVFTPEWSGCLPHSSWDA